MDRKLSKDVKLILKNRMQKNKGKEDTMASSMIHLAIVQEMRKKVSFRDINRLFLGVILPDGAVAGNSHLKKIPDTHTISNFSATDTGNT